MYKLKQGVKLPDYFKVNVNPEQSKALQEYLFSVGINWIYDAEEVDHTDKPCLYVRKRKITWGMDSDVEKEIEIKFQDYFEKAFPEKWCIQVTDENYEELRDWLHKNSSNYLGYTASWMSYKQFSEGKMLYSHGRYFWDSGLNNVFYEEITTEQFREQFGVKEIEHKIPLDKKSNEWQMSDEAQIVFNILYKKGIKFDCHDFELYLKIFEEGQNHKK